MVFTLILFFISLAGIILMIGRRLIIIGAMESEINEEEFILKLPKLEQIKSITVKKIKKYTFVVLVVTIRLYVKSSNFLKKQSNNLTQKIKTVLIKKNLVSVVTEKQEVSGFLKIISDYKKKIKKIKRKIKQEENENIREK